MTELLGELKAFTAECRPDMHEPDEQGITAYIVGDHLDNAWGEEVRGKEFIVVLENSEGGSFPINLATLIALARKAEESP